MNTRRKYQVFISSTFSDMKDERQAAVEAVLTAGHIPAGMELFSAGDESQLDAIKRWIIQSDIYLLILGARYGTIEPKTQLSYTEIEYDYAVENSKPHFALVLSDPALDAKRAIIEAAGGKVDDADRLNQFRAKVLTKVSRFVDDIKDVKIYIPEAIRGLESRHAIVGWVRTDETVDAAPLLAEVARLTGENHELASELHAARASVPVAPSGAPLAGMEDATEVSVTYRVTGRPDEYHRSFSTTWRELFALISPKLIGHPADSTMRSYVAGELLTANGRTFRSASLTEQSHNTIRVQFEALGLITVDYTKTVANTMALFWSFTDSGRALMLDLRAIRKHES